MIVAIPVNTSGSASITTTFTTASISLTANLFTIVSTYADNGGHGVLNIPTVTGDNVTWTGMFSRANAGGDRMIAGFWGYGSFTTGALTITWPQTINNGCNWTICQFKYTDVRGSGASSFNTGNVNGGGATSSQSLTVSMGGANNNQNATYGIIGLNGNATVTDGANFTNIGNDHTSSGRTIDAVFSSSFQTSIPWTWTTNQDNLGEGLELVAIPGGGTFLYNLL